AQKPAKSIDLSGSLPLNPADFLDSTARRHTRGHARVLPNCSLPSAGSGLLRKCRELLPVSGAERKRSTEPAYLACPVCAAYLVVPADDGVRRNRTRSVPFALIGWRTNCPAPGCMVSAEISASKESNTSA